MEEQSNALGLIAAFLATVLYGSCYVPVRWFEAGDGLYFQWMMCIGQLISGVFVLALVDWPPIFPLAMLGGAFFAIGNALTITIMDGIGMAVGSLLWNTVTCIVGWAVSRFGLFGSLKKVPYDNVMNIVGVIVVCIGGCFFATIKHHPMKVRPAPWQIKPQLPRRQSSLKKGEEIEVSNTTRIIATLCTVFVGCLYGNMLTPIVAYPILAKAPGIVCAVWAILLFKEIKGRWDVLHLIAGICVTVVGIALITISKVKLF
ncbi:hypothetical protein Y032_0881g2838 [Ancylostoma ceylanicum]|uniref:EamA domain-containing protein n=1 Tax=Ancylostoma ceylanicum TaxID=53326 RepID=A0A016WAG8_9BILA|nr:hypothetical protein Y032_0881g2838 [Ancylostoma ceylanicum]